MGTFRDLGDLLNRGTGGNSGAPEVLPFMRIAHNAGTAFSDVAGTWFSTWTLDGNPGTGVAPGAVAIPTQATAGALVVQTDPGGGRQKYLIGAEMAVAGEGGNAGSGLYLLYDRLLHISGFSGTTLTAQVVGGALTRNTGGVGNIAWAEIYTAVGGTSRTISMSYTDPVNSSGRTSGSVNFGNTGYQEIRRAIMLPLAAGDTGITAVASVTISATTGTAGNFGVTVAKPLAYLSMDNTIGCTFKDFLTGFPITPEVYTGACLGLLGMTSAAAFGGVSGILRMCEV